MKPKEEIPQEQLDIDAYLEDLKRFVERVEEKHEKEEAR